MARDIDQVPTPLLIQPVRHLDARGWFSETYSSARLAALGIHCDFPQDNQSYSRRAGTVRGLHFQRSPSAQAKLVTCLKGRISDVMVDLRAGSPSYGCSVTMELTDQGEQLYVPIGFAHGFVTLTDDVVVSYKVSALYDPSADAGLVWNDPALGISWPLPASGAIVSDKDSSLPTLAMIDSPFAYDGGGPIRIRGA